MNWTEYKLAEISTNIQTGPFGSQLHQSDYSECGTPVVMPKDLIAGHISEDSIARVSEDHVERLSRHKIEEGDILYSRRGDVGRCAYAGLKEVGWLCGTGCLRVSINAQMANSKYVFYQLQKAETVGWVVNHAVGATMLNLNTSILSDVPVKLPSLEIQNKTVRVLSAYDDLIENNQKQISLLEEAAQRLYKEWFVDLRFPGHEKTEIVDGVPEGWSKGTLGDIAIDSGKRETKDNRRNYNYYLPIDCLPKKSLSYQQMNDISLAESSLVAFKAKDILFGAMRPYFHKVVVARDNGLTRSTCFVINAKSKDVWEYLLMLLFDTDTIDYATQISVGTTMPYVRWKDFVNMSVLIPTIEMCKKFGEIVNPIINKANLLAEENIKIVEARDRLLPKLMSGEIEVGHEENEC